MWSHGCSGGWNYGQISQERTGRESSQTKSRVKATGEDGGFDFDFISIQHLLSERRTLSLIKKLPKLPMLLTSPLS